MKIYRKGSFWFTLLLLIIALVVVSISFSYSERARLIPLAVGIVVSILAILVLIGERYPRLIRGFDVSLTDFTKGDLEVERRMKAVSKRGVGTSVRTICAWIAGFFLLIYLVGFLIAIPVFVLLFLKIYGHIRWLNTLVVTIVTWGIIYAMFKLVMKVDLFKGILFGEITPPI